MWVTHSTITHYMSTTINVPSLDDTFYEFSYFSFFFFRKSITTKNLGYTCRIEQNVTKKWSQTENRNTHSKKSPCWSWKNYCFYKLQQYAIANPSTGKCWQPQLQFNTCCRCRSGPNEKKTMKNNNKSQSNMNIRASHFVRRTKSEK